ncbi:FAD-dependent monooxygenase [Dactylosporangium sp. NBC_01737]|uniref:FAD-dependent monooxygenase n=1 Tax=Dactylosporangium sp. NBC_01737 TaxID=2975959 RepID=UPI002E1476BC|nr:FAD-dependent monooxygenase [Dactylosporangium sp. NBC_01737]
MNGTVLIAGGGPSGLMAACELRLAGVDVVVFERLDEPPLWSRSGILQMRTVEVFRQRGMDFFAGYGPARTYNFGLIEMKGIIDPDLVALRVPQRDIELRLDARARELGADLRRGHTLVGLSDLGDAVRVEVEGPTGRYELTGDYLLGCDGGSSVVRKLAGIPFAGGGPSMPFSGLTGDIQVLDPPARPIGPELHPRGMFALFPAPDGRYRVTVLEFGAQAPDGDVPVTAAEVAEGARRVAGVEVAFGEDNLLSRFSGSTLLAESYRRGRVFLVGDAAHVHMPFGGQGLSTGVQDAVNLGWKLAATIHGWAPPELLDTYHAERHPVGRQVCDNTKAQMALLHPLERVEPLRRLLGGLVALEDVSQYFFEMLSAVGIRYPVEYPGHATHPLQGMRMPHADLTALDSTSKVSVPEALSTARGVLIDLSGGVADLPAADGWADRVDVYSAFPSVAIDAALVLVRPDGYVAWADAAGTDTEGLLAALQTWFGDPLPIPA